MHVLDSEETLQNFRRTHAVTLAVSKFSQRVGSLATTQSKWLCDPPLGDNPSLMKWLTQILQPKTIASSALLMLCCFLDRRAEETWLQFIILSNYLNVVGTGYASMTGERNSLQATGTPAALSSTVSLPPILCIIETLGQREVDVLVQRLSEEYWSAFAERCPFSSEPGRIPSICGVKPFRRRRRRKQERQNMRPQILKCLAGHMQTAWNHLLTEKQTQSDKTHYRQTHDNASVSMGTSTSDGRTAEAELGNHVVSHVWRRL